MLIAYSHKYFDILAADVSAFSVVLRFVPAVLLRIKRKLRTLFQGLYHVIGLSGTRAEINIACGFAKACRAARKAAAASFAVVSGYLYIIGMDVSHLIADSDIIPFVDLIVDNQARVLVKLAHRLKRR